MVHVQLSSSVEKGCAKSPISRSRTFARMMTAVVGVSALIVLSLPSKPVSRVLSPVEDTSQICDVQGCYSIKKADNSYSKVVDTKVYVRTGLFEEDPNKIIENPSVIGYKDDGHANCARFVRSTLNYLTHRDTSKSGIFGNAWDIPNNVQSRGGYVSFGKPNVDKLKEGDILFIRYSHSKYTNRSKRVLGNNYFTHVGAVIGFDDADMPIIAHLYHEKIDDVKVGVEVESMSQLLDKRDKDGNLVFELVGFARPNYDISDLDLLALKIKELASL